MKKIKRYYPKQRAPILGIQFWYNKKDQTPNIEIVWNQGKRDHSGLVNASMLFMLGGLLERNKFGEPQLKILKEFARVITQYEKELGLDKVS